MKAIATVALGIVLTAASVVWAGEPELHLMHMQTAPATRDAVQRAVDRFTETTGVEVRVEVHKNEPYKQKLATVLGSAEAPDVFHTWGGGILEAQVRQGGAAPFPEDFPVEGISTAVLEFCTVDGQLYAVPTDVSLVLFYYRPSVFRLHDIDVPGTFQELLDTCRALRGRGVIPIALGNLEQWPGAFYFDYLMVRQEAAGDYLAQTEEAGEPVQTPAARTAAEKINALVRHHAFNPGFNGIGYDDSRSAFFRKEASMTLMGTWLLSFALQEQEEDRTIDVDDIGVFPFPALGNSGDGDEALLGGTNAAYAVSETSRHKDLAFQLVQYLTDEQAALEWAEAWRIPARQVDLPGGPDVLNEVGQLLEQASYLQLYFDQALPPDEAEQHKAYTQSLFVGEPHVAIRIIVIVVAVLAVLVFARILRSVFGSGEGTE